MYYQEWDTKIKKSIPKLFKVAQPLFAFIDENTQRELDAFSLSTENYKSVYALKY